MHVHSTRLLRGLLCAGAATAGEKSIRAYLFVITLFLQSVVVNCINAETEGGDLHAIV